MIIRADLYASAVPRYDLSAFLMAGFEHDGETPLLPGRFPLAGTGYCRAG